VHCEYKTKKIEDTHMIVNDLDYPKRPNNPNLATDSYYQTDKQCVNKQLNTNCSRASLHMDRLDNNSSCSASVASSSHHNSKQIRTLTKAGLAHHNSECSSSTTSSTGAPSVCSSDSVKSKKYDLPTAESIQAMRGRTQYAKYGQDEFHFTEVWYPKFKQTNKLTNKPSAYPQKKRLVDYIEHTVIKQDLNPRFFISKRRSLIIIYQRKKMKSNFLFLILEQMNYIFSNYRCQSLMEMSKKSLWKNVLCVTIPSYSHPIIDYK